MEDAGPQSNVSPPDGSPASGPLAVLEPQRGGGSLLRGSKPGPRPLARKRQALLNQLLRSITPADVAAVARQLINDATCPDNSVKDRTIASRVLLDFLGKPTLQERAEVGAAAGVGGGGGPTVFVFESDPVAIRRV